MPILTTHRKDMCYCPGCSHGQVLQHIAAAVAMMGRRPESVCIVSDIGCIGTADQYFSCHTFHGLHGRAVTYAEGIKRIRPDVLVIVLIGDGGAGIGTGHLVHAARRGIDIKVMVCNNFNFGMTGGQHSPTTPPRCLTATTPIGVQEHPLDICQTVAVNGACHVGRYNTLEANCVDGILQGLQAPGFALLDLWELCVAYFVPDNKLTRQGMCDLSERLNMPFGVLAQRMPPPPDSPTIPPPEHRDAPPGAPHSLQWPARRELCVAGSAGQRVRSAVTTYGEMFTHAGLFAAQQDDFPITVRRGHSLSNLIVAARQIDYAGLQRPELVVLLSAEGARRLDRQVRLEDCSCVLAAEEVDVATIPGATHFSLRAFEQRCGKLSAALAVLTWAMVDVGWLDADDLVQLAQRSVQGHRGKYRTAAIELGSRWTNHTAILEGAHACS